jgi:hypothetical protein
MYRFCSKVGYLLYPHPDEEVSPIIEIKEIDTEIDGLNGGTLIKLGLKIPSGCSNYNEFSRRIKEEEFIFYNQLH